MVELLAKILEIERVLAELGKTPYELLKEEQKEGVVIDDVMEK